VKIAGFDSRPALAFERSVIGNACGRARLRPLAPGARQLDALRLEGFEGLGRGLASDDLGLLTRFLNRFLQRLCLLRRDRTRNDVAVRRFVRFFQAGVRWD